jgi:hypothetical protein
LFENLGKSAREFSVVNVFEGQRANVVSAIFRAKKGGPKTASKFAS